MAKASEKRGKLSKEPEAVSVKERTMTNQRNIIVKRFRIIGTNLIIYEAWEPSELMGRHSTVTFIGGKVWGRIGTDPDQSLFEHLPVGDDRSEAVRKAYQQRYQVAYDAIVEAFPEADAGKRSMGEIHLVDESGTLGKAEVRI